MKKSLFISLIIAFLGSCQGEFEDITYTIKNDSSKIVSFSFNDISETLNIDDSITYTINSEKGRFAPKNISPSSWHIRSVKLITLNNGTSGIFYTFSDNIPLTLNVKNTLTTSITIKADDFIDASGGYTLTITSNNTANAHIYTSTPNFTIVPAPSDPFPPVIDWKLEDNTINVIIK